MSVLFGRKRKIAINKAKEATYNTSLVTTAKLFNVASELGDFTPEFNENTDLATGFEEATGMDLLSYSTKYPLSFPRVHPNELAMILKFGLSGTPTVATVDTSAYKHIFKPNVADYSLYSVTIEEYIASALQFQYPGLMVNSFELSTERKGWWNLTSDLIGSGTRYLSGVDSSPPSAYFDFSTGTYVTEPPMKAGDVTIHLSTTLFSGAIAFTQNKTGADLGGSPSNITAKVESMRWRFNNNIDEKELREFGADLVGNRSERANRTQELTMTVEFEDATYLTALTAQTQYCAAIQSYTAKAANLAGAATIYYGFELIFPIVQIKVTKVTGALGKIKADLTFAVMQDTGNSLGSVQAAVWNKVTTYVG